MNSEELSKEEIISKLSDGELAVRFEESEDWKLIRESTRRLADQAIDELTKTPADNLVRIIELQLTAKFCRNFLQSILNSYKQEGALAFEEAKYRGFVKQKSDLSEK